MGSLLQSTQIRESESLSNNRILTGRISGLLEIANAEIKTNSVSAKAAISHVSSLLQQEIERPVAVDKRESLFGGLTAWQINRICAFVDSRLEESIQIKQLSEIVNLSKSHFCRAFKKELGIAPHGFIVERRLERAKQLLVASRLQLAEIAFSCGFSDQAHLCRVFRKIVGDTPTGWRRKSNHSNSF